MSTAFTALADGLIAAREHVQLLFVILLAVLAASLILFFIFRNLFRDQFTLEEYISLSVGGWLLPAALLALLWYGLGAALSPQVALVVLILLLLSVLITFFVRIAQGMAASSRLVVLSLVFLSVLFLVLRLAFVAKALLPLYFDSAQHYLITRDLLARLEQPGAAWSLANYYHLGFHFLAAFLTYLSHAQINDTMLVLGQVILALLPLPFFFLVRHVTGSNLAGMFALLLAGVGWYMPAHSVDWGKYPALTSLALLPFVLSLAYLAFSNTTIHTRRAYVVLDLLLLVGVAITIFLHSRALIFFGIVALTWILAWLWQKLPQVLQFVILGLLVAALILAIYWVQEQGILGPLFDPYAARGVLITPLVLLLSIFAYVKYPRLVFSSLLALLLVLASLFIPLGNLIPGYANMTVLDRPFVEMILYLPLALLGGFGLAALEQTVRGRTIRNLRWNLGGMIGIALLALVAVNGFFKTDFHPADCCAIASRDDLEAIQWMDQNLPASARILISSTELRVLPTDAFQGSAGGDAGTWINPLIRRTTVFLPFTTDFSQPQILESICQQQIDYVYVGKTGWAFNDSGIQAQPDKYQLVFSLPDAKIYQVIGCTPLATTGRGAALSSAAGTP